MPEQPLELTPAMLVPETPAGSPPSVPVTPRPPVPERPAQQQPAPPLAYREIKVITAKRLTGWGLIEGGELQAVATDPAAAGRALAELLRQG